MLHGWKAAFGMFFDCYWLVKQDEELFSAFQIYLKILQTDQPISKRFNFMKNAIFELNTVAKGQA